MPCNGGVASWLRLILCTRGRRSDGDDVASASVSISVEGVDGEKAMEGSLDCSHGA